MHYQNRNGECQPYEPQRGASSTNGKPERKKKLKNVAIKWTLNAYRKSEKWESKGHFIDDERLEKYWPVIKSYNSLALDILALFF